MHHSFDIHLAEKYGVEEAILIHHFQHWIRFNREKGNNFKENKTWTFQTRKDMAAHFPYWNFDKVKYLCEKLVTLGVLETNNFNKKGFDKTLWYSFVNEEQMIGIQKSITKGKSALVKGKSALGEGKSAQPIPHTKQHTEQDKLSCVAAPLVEVEKIDCEGKKVIIRKDDLFTACVQNGKDWTQEEILKCWQTLVNYSQPIRDWLLLCDGIIQKNRKFNKINKITSEEEKCQTSVNSKYNAKKDKKILSENTKTTISDPATWTRPFAKFNSLQELMGR